MATLNSFAQLAPYSFAPDFTGTDINGVEHNLQSYLDSGKTVIIDISATWCGPCWNFHQSGTLEEVYNTYGPDGTDEMMVFFIEGDSTTTNADLNAPGANSQGDWVTGTPYPIIDDANIADSYATAYFPTVYIVCPSGIVWECGQSPDGVNYWTAEQLHELRNECPSAVVNTDASILQTNLPATSACGAGALGQITPEVFIMNLGTTDTLTSAVVNTYKNGTLVNTNNWTGSLLTYASDWYTLTPVDVAATDVITCELIVAEDMDSTNNEQPVNFNFTEIGGVDASAPLEEGFVDQTSFPSNGWSILDEANNGGNWYWNDQGQEGVDGAAMFDFYFAPAGEVDYMISPMMNFSGLDSVFCNFLYTKANYLSGAGNDKLEVVVSTNCGDTWSSEWMKQGAALDTEPAQNTAYYPTADTEWERVTVDLSEYANQSDVLVAFRATSGYGNLLHLDNINISVANLVVGVNPTENTVASIYPNPSNGMFTINAKGGTSLRVFDATGALVSNLTMQKSSENIDLTSLPSGIYNVQMTIGEISQIQRVVVQK